MNLPTRTSPSTRVIPEATVDIWTAAALAERDRQVRISAPTPAQQARLERWDLQVAWRGKWFMLENKALRRDSKIELPAEQLRVLVALERAGVPIYYGLPCMPRGRTGALVALRFRPDFETWQRILLPSEVDRVASGRRLVPSEEFRAANPQPSSLRQFLAGISKCTLLTVTPARSTPSWMPHLTDIIDAAQRSHKPIPSRGRSRRSKTRAERFDQQWRDLPAVERFFSLLIAVRTSS